MNDRNLDQLLDAWMDLGPDAAPDRVAAAAKHEARNTRQTALPAWWPSWSFPLMNNTTFRYGMAVAAVIIAAVVGWSHLPLSNTGSGRPAGTPSPSPSPRPLVSQEAHTLTFYIEPMGAETEARGTVVVDIGGGGYTMTITVENLDPNGQYPIDMHPGQCPNPELKTEGTHVSIVAQTPADESGTLTYEKEFEGLWEIPEGGRTLTVHGRAPADVFTHIGCADLTE